MKKYEIVKKSSEFNDIINSGRVLKNKYYNIYYKDNGFAYAKFGLAVSKKCGNAVIRNKIKRRLRMIIDEHKAEFNTGFDYIIMVRKAFLLLSFDEMSKYLCLLLKES